MTLYNKEIEYYKNYKYKKLQRPSIRVRLKKGWTIQEACKIVNRTKKKCLINSHGRTCSVCGKYKAWYLFVKDRTSKTLYTSNCKECRQKIKKQYRSTKEGKEKDRERAEQRMKSELGRQQIQAYSLYKNGNRKNIKILKSIGERPRSRRKAKQDIRDYIKRIGREDEFYLLFK